MNVSTQQARLLFSTGLLLFIAACSSSAPQATLVPSEVALPSATAQTPTPQPSATPQPRSEIETYTVQPGDTLSRIAAAYNLQPETVLWANYDALADIADFLLEGMELTILPVDGIYHQVGGGDTVNTIAAFFAADPQAMLNWPGNKLDANNPVIQSGQWLLVPGGQRALRRRTLPDLPRTAMAVDFLEFGAGACPRNVDGGAVGAGHYVWPLAGGTLAGDGYSGVHPAADLAAQPGEAVLAADAGVVTFSGWSNFGYGYAVMLDHGNGQFSLYAGLAEVQGLCGASLQAGEPLGVAGYSAHPAGAFVHFEIRQGGVAIDPLTVLP